MLNMVRVDSKYCFWVTWLDPQAVSTRGNDVLNEPADWVSKLSRTVWAVSMAASGIPGESQYQHLGVRVSLHAHTCKACHFQSVGAPIDAFPKTVHKRKRSSASLRHIRAVAC